jgi:AraC-like DNA-binding protein
MQEQINHMLNRPFTVFLACRKGRIYFTWMILIFLFLANFIQRFGLTTTSHEYHKPLIISNYIVLFFVMYALVYMMLSYFRPDYYKIWTIRKEFCILFFFFIPATAFTTCLFVVFSVPEFILTLPAFVELQFYNFILSIFSIPTFGYFVDTQFNPAKINSGSNQKENKKSKPHLTEVQALKIIQQLNELMETQQLYLSKKCNERQVAGQSGYSIHQISYVLNNFCASSFSDFVNKYRVEHACRILQNGKDQKLKFEVVGYDCGFGSKAIFYASFRKITGQTPAEYLADLQNKPELN